MEEKYTTKSLTAHRKLFVFFLLVPNGFGHAHQDRAKWGSIYNAPQRTPQSQKKKSGNKFTKQSTKKQGEQPSF